ncbi:peptidylprolyl isomerase [Cardinium endosymbiont of Tipula unca]|uniref:peptidylprolyl isomerase n=1 Tax=Cardinium endosymbiont of Tipula unca TaxID=3066216 RepID=UPI0030D57A8C
MAIIENIRTKAGNTFVVVAICFLIVMLLGSDIGRVFSHLFKTIPDQTGTVDGDKISYVDYQNFYENFESQHKQPTAEEKMRLRDHAWRQLTEDMIYKKEVKQIGMAVGSNELVDLVQGEHIDAKLVAFFKDPETGSFDKQKLLNYLSNLSKEQQEGWCQFEKKLAAQRAKEKLIKLMQQSCFTTAIEQEKVTQRDHTVCNVDYLYIPFSTIDSALVAPTNQQLSAYMAAHKSHYKANESRTIRYVAFPVHPDGKDSAVFQKELNAILAQFSTIPDAHAFAKEKTDGHSKDTNLLCTANELPDALSKIQHTLQKGMVVGPTENEGLYTLYKVVEIKKDGDAYNYNIAIIQKKFAPSNTTRNTLLRKVNRFATQIKNLADLDTLAKREQLVVQKEIVNPSDTSIGEYGAREVVRWLYHEASIGKVSKVFNLGDAYLLAIMVNKTKEGDLQPLDSVFSKVYYKVVNQAKAKIIVDKFKQMNVTTLPAIAEGYGEKLTVKSIEELRFSQNNDPHIKNAKAFIGKCFGLVPGSISDPIVDHEGVFIACVKSKQPSASNQEPAEKSNQYAKEIDKWMQVYYIGKGMEELAKVTDERYKFE